MCTALSFCQGEHYFGRTLDHSAPFGEAVTVTPRRFPLLFREAGILGEHYAMIGIAHMADGYPLYYDAVNERGLGMAGLMFAGNAVYRPSAAGRDNIESYAFIHWILAQCATVREACALLERINLTDTAFSRSLPPAELHWMIADRNESVTVESVRDGLFVYPNPTGVLTNNPTFPMQCFRLNDYMHLSPQPPENRFSGELDLHTYSLGMGALGLPGDLSSASRFVRAAFTRAHACTGESEAERVGQFFHILGTVEQVRGCCAVGDGFESTLYTACCNTDRGIYYYTTYGCRQITAVDLRREALDGDTPVCYPLVWEEQIRYENGGDGQAGE